MNRNNGFRIPFRSLASTKITSAEQMPRVLNADSLGRGKNVDLPIIFGIIENMQRE